MKSFSVCKGVLIAVFFSSQVFAATTTTTNVSTGVPEGMGNPSVETVGNNIGAMMTAIVANVQAKISQDPTFAGADIAVTSEPGIIIVLNGTVDTQAQVDAAISAAKEISGVADVHSNLIVRGATMPPKVSGNTTTTTTSVTTPNP